MPKGQSQIDESGTWRRWEIGTPGQCRIIVAEDDREMRRLIADTLTAEGYVVDEAPDGPKLLTQIIGAEPPVDLVISDHRMPLSSGLQVLAGLRYAGWRLPFILLSAFGDDELRSKAAKLDAIFLAKPFELEALQILVRAALIRS
jgi:DNA-binding response OmpR family regulator